MSSPCHFEYYDSRVSYTSFPTGLFLKRLTASSNKSINTIQGDFLAVNVFLEDLQVTTVTSLLFLGRFGGKYGIIYWS